MANNRKQDSGWGRQKLDCHLFKRPFKNQSVYAKLHANAFNYKICNNLNLYENIDVLLINGLVYFIKFVVLTILTCFEYSDYVIMCL